MRSLTNCACGNYLPASRRKAGLDECENCEKQTKRDIARNEQMVALIDAVDATPVHDVVGDYCGFNETTARLTCNTCGSTLLIRNGGSEAERSQIEWMTKHPLQAGQKIRMIP